MSKRVLTAAILIPCVLLLIWFGNTVLALGCIVCMSFALSEEYRALTAAGHRPVSWPTWLAMITGVPLALVAGSEVIAGIILTACLLTIICVIFRKDPRLEDVLMSLMPLLTIMLPSLCMIYVSYIQPLPLQRTMMSLLLAVPILGDTFAMYVGSWIRGPKLCPAVSPNKTVSGAIGGLVGSVLGAIGVGLIADAAVGPDVKVLLPQWYTYVLLGLIGGVASQMGDLFASLVKRHCGIKDFSNIFPGHGGMLDRLDSILFMAFVIFGYRILL